MAFGNVIPIDAEVGQQLARRQLRFRRLVAALGAVWIAILVPTLLFTPLPPVAPFAVLALMVLLAEHRFVLFGDETSMSASIIVIVASIFVFADTAPLAGPMLIASIGGIYLPQIRSRAWSKACFNSTGIGIAAWLAAASAELLAATDRSPRALGTICGTLAVYWTANNLIVAGHQVALGRQKFSQAASNLVSSDTEVLVWTATACLGACSAHTTTVAIAFVAIVVAIRLASLSRMVVRLRRSRHAVGCSQPLIVWLGALAMATPSRSSGPVIVALGFTVALQLTRLPNHPYRLMATGLPLIAVASLGAGLWLTGIVAMLSLIELCRRWHSPSCWAACVAVGTAAFTSLANANVLSSSSRLIPILCATLMAPIVAAMISAARVAAMHRGIDRHVTLGMLVPTRYELLGAGAAILAGALFERHPVVVLAAATVLIGARYGVRFTGRRSSVSASR